MKEVMYCVCGFSANSGNKLAKHLGTHGCQSAYASLEDAERARNIPEGQEDKFFIYNRDCKDGREEEKEIGKDKDNDQIKNVAVENEVVEEENLVTKTEEEENVETSQGGKTEELRNEEGKQPGPGGLLFGTLFNYLGDEGDQVPPERERETSEVNTDEKQIDANDFND